MSFFSLGRRAHPQSPYILKDERARERQKTISLSFVGALLIVGALLAACSSGNNTSNGGGKTVADAVPTASVALNQLKWCGSPSETFRDQASPNPAGGTVSASNTQLGPADGKPRDVKDWNTFKNNLGFTTYLPNTLPAGSCLLSVSGSLRDAVFGSNFTITYILPDQSAMSFSQAPARSQNLAFQCNVSQSAATTPTVVSTSTPTGTSSATPTAATDTQKGQNPTQLCNGVRDKTNIVFSSRGTMDSLKQIFQNLQADVAWQPAR